MSVVKMIVADDRYYVSGEPHGSRAERIYAACSKNPKTLEELNKLLPEFEADEDLNLEFAWNDGLDLQPVDAGLIVIDLAKKWIFAEDTYFGAHRTGSYSTDFPDDSKIIRYAFSDEWQFVSEAKWFNYLHSCDLKPFCDQIASGFENEINEVETTRALKRDTAIENTLIELEEDEFDEKETLDDERDDSPGEIFVKYSNRLMILIDAEPDDDEEKQEYRILEHILKYDQWAEEAQNGIENAREKIACLQIELQAVENLWKRTDEPRWALKRIRFQALIKQQEKRISRLSDVQHENAAMASELRSLVKTEKYRSVMEEWQYDSDDFSDDLDDEIPY